MALHALPELILASASPRRRQLLAEHRYRAEIIPAQVEESVAPWLTTRELVLLNARLKAADVSRQHPASVVLGVDTLVSLDGEALGKPPDLAAARAMLARLSGREHLVYSGVCLLHAVSERAVTFAEETRVTFQPLDAARIEHYLSLVDPLDKAGSYGAQEHPEFIIARVDGSWSNVLGLPMERLTETLAREFLIHPAP